MHHSKFRISLGVLILTSVAGFAQVEEDRCAVAQRALEGIVKEYPEKAVETLALQVRRNPACAGPLVESAIRASQASDELVAQLVTVAVRSAPEKAVVIAESAIAVAPSASDEVAEVIQTILGDCKSIAEDVTISIGRNRDRLLMVLEDALRSHGNCACEIVTAAVQAANGSAAVVSQIVEMSVSIKPALAAEIAECASAAAPRLATAVQKGLDSALQDSKRGVGSLPAAVAFEESQIPITAESAEDQSRVDDAVDAAEEISRVKGDRFVEENRYREENRYPEASAEPGAPTAAGYGKNAAVDEKNPAYGKGKQRGEEILIEEEEEWGWDWINWGAIGGINGAVYMIAPSGGVVPPGVLTPQRPLSPSDPKIDEKTDLKDPHEDPKKFD